MTSLTDRNDIRMGFAMGLVRDWGATIAAGIAAAAAVAAAFVSASAARETARKDYVSIAVTILADKQSSPPMRHWAVDVLNQLSPVRMSAQLAGSLANGATQLPGGALLSRHDAAFGVPPPLLVPCASTPAHRQPDGSATSADSEATIRDGRFDLKACDDKRLLAVESWPG